MAEAVRHHWLSHDGDPNSLGLVIEPVRTLRGEALGGDLCTCI